MKISSVKIMINIVLGFCLLTSCSEDDAPHYPPPTTPDANQVGTAKIWVTGGDKGKLLAPQDDVSIVDSKETDHPSVTVNAEKQYQEIEGFGAALTGSSAYVMKTQMNASQRNNLLSDLFDPKAGIGLDYLRLTIGSSDFSLSDFTYDDMPYGQEDPDLTNFSIARDEANVIPIVNAILSLNPKVKLMGSPWSPPAWMKDSQSLNGGKLKPEWYETYANYFVKYIRAYARHGLKIDAVTPQNEPLHEDNYPTTRMEAPAEANFIKRLGPAIQNAELLTKIIAYDHNFDQPQYPINILQDPEAEKYVTGSAFHGYGGQVEAMSQVHNAFPEKGVYFTELSGGAFSPDFASNLRYYIRNTFIGTTRNWSKMVLFWNLALNENHGPTNNGCTDCRGVVTISPSGEVEKNEEFYSLAHFSKFVKRGAHRIDSGKFPEEANLYNVAFENPDGSKIMIVLNDSPESKTFSVIDGENRFDSTLTPRSVATIVW